MFKIFLWWLTLARFAGGQVLQDLDLPPFQNNVGVVWGVVASQSSQLNREEPKSIKIVSGEMIVIDWWWKTVKSIEGLAWILIWRNVWNLGQEIFI